MLRQTGNFGARNGGGSADASAVIELISWLVKLSGITTETSLAPVGQRYLPEIRRAPFGFNFAAIAPHHSLSGVTKGEGAFVRKMMIIVASAVALGAATMTSGALAQRGHGGGMGSGAHFGGGMGGGARFGGGRLGGEPHLGRHEFGHRDFDRRFVFRRHRFIGAGFGVVATGPYWWGNDWDDGCLSRWERTPSGWRQRLC